MMESNDINENTEVPKSEELETEGPHRLKPKKPKKLPNDPGTIDEDGEEAQEHQALKPGSEDGEDMAANFAQRRVVIRRCLAVSGAFVLMIAAMLGLAVLQSSLNAEIGTWGLCANFAAVVVSCLLFSTYLVQRLGCKWAMLLGMSCMMVWMAANLYPHWATIIPTAVIMGLGWAPLWTAQCTFFTISGIELAKLRRQAPDQVIARAFGFFFMAFMTGPIWGNLLSSGILSQAHRFLPTPATLNTSVTTATVDPVLLENVSTTSWSKPDDQPLIECGANFCPQLLSTGDSSAIRKPPQILVMMLVGVYLVLGVIGMLIIVFLVPNLSAHDKDEVQKTRFSLKLAVQTLKQLQRPLQVLMVPLNVYIGMEEGFMTAEFTRGFVACTLGVKMLGFVTISYAFVAAIVSFTSGHMIRLVGRPPVFLTGGLSHMACQIGLLVWEPDPDRKWIFFVMAGLWGLGDAILQTQTNAFYGLLFTDNSEAAFSNYRMWEALGLILSLTYSSYMCVRIKIYILMAVLTLGMMGYIITEALYRRQLRDEEEREKLEAEEKEEAAVEAEKALLHKAESDVFYQYADMMRRKSSVVVPQTATRTAAELLRQHSLHNELDEEDKQNLVERRLSVIVPSAASPKPRRKISESAMYKRQRPTDGAKGGKPRRTTVHEMPDQSKLDVPNRPLQVIEET